MADPIDFVFLAETRVRQNASCDQVQPSLEQIELNLESAAFHRCLDEKVEMRLAKEGDLFNKVHVCQPGQGGEVVYQRLYNCADKANVNAIFSGGDALLMSDQDTRTFGLIYMGYQCLRLRVIGMTFAAAHPAESLRDLASNLVLTENGVVRNGILAEGANELYVQYRVACGMRSSSLKVQNLQPGQSLTDLIQKKLGVNPETGFPYGIQILAGECR